MTLNLPSATTPLHQLPSRRARHEWPTIGLAAFAVTLMTSLYVGRYRLYVRL